MRKKVSLKDIAQHVGVSTALVSYVLNNKKEGRISKEVAAKIRETATSLNYRANNIARSLKTSKTFTIGLIVADISNAFYSTLARFIEDEAEKSGYTVLFGSCDESVEKLEKLIHVLLDRQVDGLLISPVEKAESQLNYLKEIEIPFVLIDRYYPQLQTSYVAIDNYKAAYKMMAHLIENGRQSIGMITYNTSMFHLNERTRGMTDALKDAGLQFPGHIQAVSLFNPLQEVPRAIDKLLQGSDPVDALTFTANNLSVAALKYLNTLGIRVPGELAIAAFDESDAAELFYSPLTYIKQPLCEMAQQATRILLDSIGNNNTITQLNLDAPLIIGKSSGIALHRLVEN